MCFAERGERVRLRWQPSPSESGEKASSSSSSLFVYSHGNELPISPYIGVGPTLLNSGKKPPNVSSLPHPRAIRGVAKSLGSPTFSRIIF